MGIVAGGFATSHVLMSPEGVEAQSERVFEGMKEIGRRIRALEPDVIVMISTDHLMNFKMDLQVPFIVGMCESYTPFGEMEIPKQPFPGHRAFAEDFLAFAAEQGFDLARAEALRPDHGIAIPNAIINPDGKIPVVPLYINAAMTPPPSPTRAWQLGRVLRKAIETVRPKGEKVVVLGTGGLSHWICLPDQGRVNEDFDRSFMQALCAGGGAKLATGSAGEILEQAGNGGLEVLNWLCMAGAAEGIPGEVVYYDAMPSWLTGMGGIALAPDRQPAQDRKTGAKLVRLVGIDEVPEGTMKRVTPEGFDALCVYHTEAGFFVTEDTCTHGLASLSKGELEGQVVYCPYHGGAFDVATGRATEFPCTDPLRTWQPIVENAAIWIET
jgi:protocatechuate 4,5-dioxygenase beta chain/2'-aminobiphenyl-2,3-diol 1,2-dioxygenase large subunit